MSEPRFDMRDFPLKLRTSLEAERIAAVLYYATRAIHGGYGQLWDQLLPSTKRIYREQAVVALEALKPTPADTPPLRLVKP